MNSDETALWLVGAFLALLIVVSVVSSFWLAPQIFFDQKEEARDIAEQSNEQSLENYREFRTLWFEIKAQRGQLENYREEHEQFHELYGDNATEWDRQTKIMHERKVKQETGAENQVENLVSDYNAMASDPTRAIYACGLPYQIDQKLYIADATGVKYTSEEAAAMTPPKNPEDCKFSGTVTADG